MSDTELLNRKKLDNLTEIDEKLKKTILNKKKNNQIICIGDSLTGWNTEDFLFGDDVFPVYPNYLQNLMPDKEVMNYGFAGAISEEGIARIKAYVPIFPNAKFYIIGFGTNDLANENLEETSKKIINNLNTMIDMVLNAKKIPLLLNVPYVNTKHFSEDESKIHNHQRDYHNKKLEEEFSKEIKIVDICSKLKDEHFEDALHTNKKGAELIAKLVYDSLQEQLWKRYQ